MTSAPPGRVTLCCVTVGSEAVECNADGLGGDEDDRRGIAVRLAPGPDERAFLEAAERSQSGSLGQQAGFVSRDLLRAEDGSWMDVVRFESAQATKTAIEGFAGHPDARAFESMLDPSAVSMSHWSVVRSW